MVDSRGIRWGGFFVDILYGKKGFIEKIIILHNKILKAIHVTVLNFA